MPPTIRATGAPAFSDVEPLFRLPIRWDLAGATANGYIVQHVQRNEKFKRVGQAQRGRQIIIVTGPQNVAANDYWEAWHVAIDPAGAVTITPIRNGLHDIFVIAKDQYHLYRRGWPMNAVPDKDHCKGTWKIRGRVYWVPEGSFDAAHWWRAKDQATGEFVTPRNPQAVMEAGGLLSRYDKPVVGDGLNAGGSLGDILLTRA